MSKELLIKGGYVVTVDPDLGDLPAGDVLVADGLITPGKQADIAVIDMRSPHLDGFGDPVAVMVLGAGPADVETVIVGGDVVKRDGKLAGDHVGHALELMHAARERLRT